VNGKKGKKKTCSKMDRHELAKLILDAETTVGIHQPGLKPDL